jgi:hypothetical protein
VFVDMFLLDEFIMNFHVEAFVSIKSISGFEYVAFPLSNQSPTNLF